jgi:pyruvate/2-oxoglutarate dehydrogenase complex dihydrolipoamide acyltransferase (E2) component
MNLRDRLNAQREAVIATGEHADDALAKQQPTAPAAAAQPRAVAPPPPPAAARPAATPTSRTQGVTFSSTDDVRLDELLAYCKTRGLVNRRDSNASRFVRSGIRLLYDLMQRDPAAFAAALAKGRETHLAVTSRDDTSRVDG